MAEKKVLVVDDKIHIIHVLKIALERAKFSVIIADNGESAFWLATKEKPDIIVTDTAMPIMSGIELVEKLRKTEEIKDIPVILLTSRGFALSPEQSSSLKVSGTLSKPFSPRELLGMIEDILS